MLVPVTVFDPVVVGRPMTMSVVRVVESEDSVVVLDVLELVPEPPFALALLCELR